MASEEHLKLSTIIKSTHETLRKDSKEKGADKAWDDHLKKESQLSEYANAMRKLAEIWEENSTNESHSVISRVQWISNYINSYFFTEELYKERRLKEERTLEINNLPKVSTFMEQMSKVKLLDVGSCFNPFSEFANFDVTAFDLCPANEKVLKGDFLKIKILKEAEDHEKEVLELKKESFHAVVFSLLLEYMPSSDQRILCCEKAYDLLLPEGILVIVTPDSQHVGKNAKIMKNWRYTLAKMGFSRIKFEKLTHISCMVFRKCIDKEISRLWAEDHKEDYMEYRIDIPQDFKD
ncbi:C7orf60 family protein [Megaselia abdita]